MKYKFKNNKSKLVRNIKNNFIITRLHGLYTDIIFHKKNNNHRETFSHIFQTNQWKDSESLSGPGSNSIAAKNLTTKLPALLNKYNIKKLLDTPCGDFNWMSKIDFSNVQYIGGDIVPELIDYNQTKFGKENISFIVIDICNDPLPETDIILVRDCLVHMKHELVMRFFKNLCKSNIKYLLVTSFPLTSYNHDIKTGNWWPMNIEKPPFNLPKPIDILIEDGDEFNGQFPDKSLLLYKIADLKNYD